MRKRERENVCDKEKEYVCMHERERERKREIARGSMRGEEYRGGHLGERERAGGRFEATGS